MAARIVPWLQRYLPGQKEHTGAEAHIRLLSQERTLPEDHIRYLHSLKQGGFEPRVVYDIGACVLHWTKEAQKLWPHAQFVLFDAFDRARFLYDESGCAYHVGVLSDVDGREVTFYQNDWMPTGNSYYREIGSPDHAILFPKGSGRPRTARSLDSVVSERGFPLPDFVKMDVQGSELDVVVGGSRTLASAERMILELQHADYNEGAPKRDQVIAALRPLGWHCSAPLFSCNGSDGDYGFERSVAQTP